MSNNIPSFLKGDYLHLEIVGFEFGAYAAHHSAWDCTTVHMFLLMFRIKQKNTPFFNK